MIDASPSHGERITVTYAASPAVLSAPLTPHFVHLLKEQLPLRNLHWRPSQSTLDAVAVRAAQQGKSIPGPSSLVPGSTIRTIQTLDVALKPLTDEIKRWRGDPGYFEQPGNAGLLDRPFVHLYLVVCEDSEHYRSTVRNEIRSWISSLSFFHSKAASTTVAAPASATSPSVSASFTSHAPSGGTPTLGSSSRNSFGFGNFRSSTPPTRPGTPNNRPSNVVVAAAPAAGGSGSGPQTPTTTVPSMTTNLLKGITEPEYLIVLINPPEGAGVDGLGGSGTSTPEPKSGMGRFINKSSKGNVLEKIKADFNTSKKEHVVHLSRLPPVLSVPLGRSGMHSMDPTIWADLITKMKEASSTTFTTTIEAQEDEIMRVGATRGQQGWDFCNYFLAKDSLARTLEGVGLKDDAIGQYEDLEIVFAQAMQNGSVSFAPIGGDGPNDDSLPLLDVTKKPYQELIRRREISLFDFRCYLFARKSALLGKMGKVAAVMREAPLFIGAIGRMLKRNKALSNQWIESWIFSASLDVVEQCQAWLIQRGDNSTTSIDDQLSPAFHSNKSELLDLARRQLDRIGIEAGHLPACEPFDCSLMLTPTRDYGVSLHDRELPPLPPDAQAEEHARAAGLESALEVVRVERKPSRPELVQAIESQEHFDSHYLALCDRILSGYNIASRKRNSLLIRTIVATLNFHRERYESAHKAFADLVEAYGHHRFDALEAHCLSKQLECHERLQMAKDRHWVASILAALKLHARTDGLTGSAAAPEVTRWQHPQRLFEELRTAASILEKEIPVSGFASFSILVSDRWARLASSEDGSLLSVSVTSSLPFELQVEDVRVCLTSLKHSHLWYTSSKTVLRPGVTRLELFCPSPASGIFSVDVTQIRVSKLIFQYADSSAVQQGVAPAAAAMTDSKRPTILKVPRDGAAIGVEAHLPRKIDLDQPRLVEIELFSGRNDVETAEIAVQTSGGAVAVDCASAYLVQDALKPNSAVLEAATGGQRDSASPPTTMTLKSLCAKSLSMIRVPLTFIPEAGTMALVISVSYTTSTSQRCAPTKKRMLRATINLQTALPLGVNVQDFFRTSCLLSKFTISASIGGDGGGGGAVGTGVAGSLRLRPVRLSLEGERSQDSEYQVQSPHSTREVSVTPRQPATFVFKILKGKATTTAQAPEGQDRTRFRLTVEFKTLREEATHLALSQLDEVLLEKGDERLQRETPMRRLLESAFKSYIHDRLELPAYSIAGEIRTGDFDARWWRSQAEYWETSEDRSNDLSLQTEVIEMVRETLTRLEASSTASLAMSPSASTSHPTQSGEKVSFGWRQLTIPVEIPTIDIVNCVTLRLHSTAQDSRASADSGARRNASTPTIVVVGKPVTLHVSISSTNRWSGQPEHSKDGIEMVYDLMPDFDSWLVTGLKRDLFRIFDDSEHVVDDEADSAGQEASLGGGKTSKHEFSVTVVPLKTGSLCLPTVVVRPLAALTQASGTNNTNSNSSGSGNEVAHIPSCETYIQNQAQRVVVVPQTGVTKAFLIRDNLNLNTNTSSIGEGPAGIMQRQSSTMNMVVDSNKGTKVAAGGGQRWSSHSTSTFNNTVSQRDRDSKSSSHHHHHHHHQFPSPATSRPTSLSMSMSLS